MSFSFSGFNRRFFYIFVVVSFLFFGSSNFVLASTDQPAPTESEVLVIYNSAYTTDSDGINGQDSLQIANYYDSKRPGVTVHGFAMPLTEEITWAQYDTDIKAQLEDYLTTNNLENTFKIIVTVKGVPLKIMGDPGHHDPFTSPYLVNYAAVDAAISMLYQDVHETNDELMHPNHAISNPYYNTDPGLLKNNHFKSNYFTAGDFTLRYLVSRLDGYTLPDITAMIDHGLTADQTSSGYWILDRRLGAIVDRMYSANDTLLGLAGLNQSTIYDDTASYITSTIHPIMGYTSYGDNADMGDGYVSNVPDNANHLDFTLLSGAVFSTYESYNAWGFISQNQAPECHQGQLGEWIQIGGSGGIGNIYEPWSSAIANENIWMPAYAIGYPWVEAVYMSIPYAGFVQIVLGDPLMVIADSVPPASVSDMQATSGDRSVTLTWVNPVTDFYQVKIVRKTDSYPTNFSDGTLIYDGPLATKVNTGLTNGTTYYYAAFAYDNSRNYSALDDGSKITAVPADTTPPASVTNMAATAGDTTVSLTWTKPGDADLAGVKIVRKAGSYPTNYSDGDSVYNGLLTTFNDTVLTNGTTYYYAAFAYDEVPNYSTLGSTSKVTATPIDNIAPASVTNVVATGGNASASLSWTKPGDADLAGVKIVRKAGSYPTNYSDGTPIYDGMATSTSDSGLTNGTTYYYAAFAYDEVPNYSTLISGSKASAYPYQPGGGGGGGGGSSMAYCISVTYSDWSTNCSNNKQSRSVLSRSPSTCSLTVAQQLDLQRDCQININLIEPTETNSNSNGALNNPSNILQEIGDESIKISIENFENYIIGLGKSIDLSGEQEASKKYNSIISSDKKISLENQELIIDFIFYGTPSTNILGEGERAGVVNSYFKAYGRLPDSQAEWQDVLKIANGRWPSERVATTETKAEVYFKKVYGRQADMKNNIDENAVMVVSYGLIPSKRNLQSEKIAIKSYKWIYKKAPQDPLSWNIVRAIAYSGAKR